MESARCQADFWGVRHCFRAVAGASSRVVAVTALPFASWTHARLRSWLIAVIRPSCPSSLMYASTSRKG
jgi:hypothetical protein